MEIKVLAIYTDFKHHGEDAGYKQILKYIKPVKSLGINERDSKIKPSKLQTKYHWLFEFEAYKFRKQINLIHILYGENYFRWSHRLFNKIPIVATFHQPAELLERDIINGDLMGRVGRLMHLLNRNRFKKLAAAIVTNSSQISVLEKVMPKEKIHFIPLGVHLDKMNYKFENYLADKSTIKKPVGTIITVGNWQRDWDFYFSIIEKCPNWKFALVNKSLDEIQRERAGKYSNLTFYNDITDDELFNLFLNSDLHFIPVKGLAASNALLQGLSLGCPIVLTDINADQFKNEGDIIKLYQKNNLDDCIEKMNAFINQSPEKYLECKMKAHYFANNYSWEEIAKRTIEIYKQII